MFTAYVIVALILAALLIYSATRKLSHRPGVVASYARVGVPEHRLNLLAILLFAGATGLIAGIIIEWIGITAGACLVVYFAVAIAAHLQHDDIGNVTTPGLLLVLAAVAVVLRYTSMG